MKVKVTLLTLVLLMALFTGCAKKDEGNATPSTSPAPTTAATTAPTTAATTAPTKAAETPTVTKAAGETPDVVTTASIVNTEEAFLKAISKDGTWIICLLEDMSTDKELLIEGEFKNGKKDDAGKEIIQRKLALYSQDEDRNITARYTLTAPKLIVTSPNASIQHGTFKGDLYVSVKDFQLIDATVDGNVYFSSEEVKSSFKMDDKSKVTGKQEMNQD
jgi:hypothetical protein